MKNNQKIDIYKYQHYVSEDILLKYLNNKLSAEDIKIVELMLQNDESFSDMLDGLLRLEKPEDIVVETEKLNKKIDAFSRNIKKQNQQKYLLIRQIMMICLIISAAVLSFLVFKEILKYQDKYSMKFDKNGYLISDDYDEILYISDLNKYLLDNIIKPKNDSLIIEKYIVEEHKIYSENIEIKKLKKINNNFDFYEEEYYTKNNPNFKTAEFKNILTLNEKLKQLGTIKSFIIIISIDANGIIENTEFYENKNNLQMSNKIKEIFLSIPKCNPAQLNNNNIPSKIAFFVDSI